MTENKFDIIELPSEGKFYKNGCKKVKVYDLTLVDEEIMKSPNLLQSGEMIDRLLERKIQPSETDAPFISPSKMLIGDRLALLIYLRVTMDNIYKINVRDTVTGEIFKDVDFDLTTLKTKDITVEPNDNLEFDFYLPKCEAKVTFKLVDGEIEREIRQIQIKNQGQVSLEKVFRLERIITSVNGNTDRGQISSFVRLMPISDANKLIKFMDDVTPGFDLNITIPHPKTPSKHITQPLEFTAEFFFPSIG